MLHMWYDIIKLAVTPIYDSKTGVIPIEWVLSRLEYAAYCMQQIK